jgi:predicted translin family RNA/ssDNA-binding protein
MMDKKDSDIIKKQLVDFDNKREELIKRSRDILRMSKQIIYSVHRENLKEAETLLKTIEKEILSIRKSIISMPKLDYLGAYTAAMQEYVEAKCYFSYVNDDKIPGWKSLKVDVEDYLLGICDLTGELERRAVVCATKDDTKEVYKIKETVEQIFGFFLSLDLRNGELRKKSDSIKWNLKKIENVVYDLKMRRDQ